MSTYDDEGGDPACWAHLFDSDETASSTPAPAPLPGRATVLQLSDIHLTRTPGDLVQGADPTRRLLTVLRCWQETGWSADLVLLTGDNADDGSIQAYQRLHEALVPLGAPILAVAGNHDDRAQQEQVFGDADTAEVGRWRVAALTSAVPQQTHGTIDAAAAARRLDALDGGDGRPTVAAIHHPPVSRSTHQWFRLDGGDDLLATLAERPYVRMLVSGHLHDVFAFDGPGDLALLGAPSALVAIGHDGDTFEVGVDAPTGARVLHLADDGSYSTTLLDA
jgi:Icc protein